MSATEFEAGIGHNEPPEETVQEIARAAQQTKDVIDDLKDQADRLEAPYLAEAKSASSMLRAQIGDLQQARTNLVTRISRWQAEQRRLHPFADPKEVARVIEGDEVLATSREYAGIEIFKPDLVPRDLCDPSEAKIKAALALGQEVPGTRRTSKFSTVMR